MHAEAQKVGYPLMIKVLLSGGVEGMRVVTKHQDFAEVLESACSEARNDFSYDRVFLEILISGPRHIDFQIFYDEYVNVIHLFARDCSLQRRHQKIIEESRSPFLEEELSTSMATVTVAASKDVKY